MKIIMINKKKIKELTILRVFSLIKAIIRYYIWWYWYNAPYSRFIFVHIIYYNNTIIMKIIICYCYTIDDNLDSIDERYNRKPLYTTS